MSRQDIEDVAPVVRAMIAASFAHVPPWVSRDDLFQVAMEAVCRTAPRYDHRRGARFSTFAQYRADGAIRDYLRAEQPGTRAHPQAHPLSLDEIYQRPNGDDGTIADTLAVDDPEPADDRLARRLFAAVDQLPADEARAIRLYAEAELTQAEIAELEGVCASRICQRIRNARRRLRPMVKQLVAA